MCGLMKCWNGTFMIDLKLNLCTGGHFNSNVSFTDEHLQVEKEIFSGKVDVKGSSKLSLLQGKAVRNRVLTDSCFKMVTIKEILYHYKVCCLSLSQEGR